MPIVPIANCAEQLASDSNCFTVTECARPDDVLTAADVQAMCVPPGGGAAVPCETINQSATVLQPPPKVELTAQYPGDANLANPDADIGALCKVQQSETAGKPDSGGSSPQSGGNKKWGVNLTAGFNSNYSANPGPFGIALPLAQASANVDLSGLVRSGRSTC